MRLMFRSCLSEALGDQRADPDALGLASQLAAALHATSASLSGCEPCPGQDGRQVAHAAPLASAALSGRPRAPSARGRVQQLGG